MLAYEPNVQARDILVETFPDIVLVDALESITSECLQPLFERRQVLGVRIAAGCPHQGMKEDAPDTKRTVVRLHPAQEVRNLREEVAKITDLPILLWFWKMK